MKNRQIITKSNELNEARYKLSALEQKLILSVVAEIQPDDEDFKTYQLKINDLIKLMKLKGQSLYTELKQAIDELISKRLTIVKHNPESVLITHWFSSVEYFHGEGYIEFSFDPKLKPYLLKLKERFVSYHLKNIVHLKSSYSIRIYELLKQYEKIGHRKFQLDELKKILGIQKTEYKEYSNFKIRVLNPAQIEIPKKTDLQFSFSEIKNGRKVSYIKFFDIKKKFDDKKNNILKDQDYESNNTELDSLINLVSNKHKENIVVIRVITELCNQYSYNHIARNISYTNKKSNDNYLAFLKKAIENDWGLELEEEEKRKQAKHKIEQERKKIEIQKEEEERKKQELIDSYIQQNYEKLKQEVIKNIDKNMLREIENNTALGRMALLGEMNKMAEKEVE